MANDMIYIDGKRAKKGERMMKGTKWRLADDHGQEQTRLLRRYSPRDDQRRKRSSRDIHGPQIKGRIRFRLTRYQ